jgi:hypothetical protein
MTNVPERDRDRGTSAVDDKPKLERGFSTWDKDTATVGALICTSIRDKDTLPRPKIRDEIT